MTLPLNLIAPWRGWIAAALIAAVLGFVGWQQLRIANLRADVATANAKVREFEAAYTILANQVGDQNAKVQKWETAAQTARQKGRQATREAERRIRVLESEVERMGTAQAANTGDKTCSDAMNEIRASIGRVAP